MSSSAHKIAIIGAGSVGAAIANSLLLRRIAGDIYFVDIDPKILHAQVQDLADSAFLSNTRVHEGSQRDAAQCDIVIISAGAKQKAGESRLALVHRSYQILKNVLDGLKPLREDAILLVVANPVDVLTYFAQQLSGLPKSQVLGSGTFLDSTRLRSTLAGRLKVRPFMLDLILMSRRLIPTGCRDCSPCIRARRAWRYAVCGSYKIHPLTDPNLFANRWLGLPLL